MPELCDDLALDSGAEAFGEPVVFPVVVSDHSAEPVLGDKANKDRLVAGIVCVVRLPLVGL